MSLLATLRAKKQNREVVTMTVATGATHEGVRAPTVARVATVTVAKPGKTPWAANNSATPDSAPASDPDRWCWPHSSAMNTGEIDTCKARMARFTGKGVSNDEAERLAYALVIRDREGDERRLCLECPHVQGFGRWRCGNWQVAGMARQGLASDLVVMLQRCGGFNAATNMGTGSN